MNNNSSTDIKVNWFRSYLTVTNKNNSIKTEKVFVPQILLKSLKFK